MKQQRFFALPDDGFTPTLLQGICGAVAGEVPDAWEWLQGKLTAPVHLVRDGTVSSTYGFGLEVSGRLVFYPNSVVHQDLLDMALNPRLPLTFSFQSERMVPRKAVFASAREIARELFEKGYQSNLTFYKDELGMRGATYSAWCSIHSGAWKEEDPSLRIKQGSRQPACVVLGWEKEYGGSPEDIDPIVQLCQKLDLKEFQADPEAQKVA